jgi:hypothetical protein
METLHQHLETLRSEAPRHRSPGTGKTQKTTPTRPRDNGQHRHRQRIHPASALHATHPHPQGDTATSPSPANLPGMSLLRQSCCIDTIDRQFIDNYQGYSRSRGRKSRAWLDVRLLTDSGHRLRKGISRIWPWPYVFLDRLSQPVRVHLAHTIMGSKQPPNA